MNTSGNNALSNTNTTWSTTMSTELNKTFYDRQLLESAKTRFVFAKYGQKRNIPAHNGKNVQFRRWELFDPQMAMNGLEEGVTPSGQTLNQSSVDADIHQYGAFVEVSDMLNLSAYDDVINDSVELLGEQLGTVVEWVTRDEISSGTNVQYAAGVSERAELTANCKLTVDEIRKAVRSLKKAKARMFSENGRKPHFICICSPDAVYDLQSDPLWQDVSKYANAENIYSGEIGRMFGVVFVESTECSVFTPTFTNSVAAESTTQVINLTTPLTPKESDYLYLNGRLHIEGIGYVRVDPMSIERGGTSIILETELPEAPAENAHIMSDDSSKDGSEIHSTIVFGKDSYGVISIEGSDTIESIVKPCGSAGADDPLNQRATIGAKVMGFAAKILNELWIVRIEHCVGE